MEASKKGNNGAVKRKRLDARTFKQHITQSKKTEGLIAPTPENSNQKFQESCSKDKDTHCEKKQKIDSEVNSELGIGEEKSGVPEASNVLSCEAKHGELLKDGALDCKKISEHPPHCKKKVTKHVEYWVPVSLSYAQLEKYCEILIKNRMLLCSDLNKGLLDSLQDILATIKKCCDHPYLVDSSLQKFLNDGRSNGDYLSNGIEVSGKLLLLDKLLQEVKEKQLRVVIVFQPMASANFPCFVALDVSSCQTQVHVPFELDQTQVRQGNLGSNDQPVVQTQLQSSVGQEHPHTNSGMAVINQSVNSYIGESSSLRSNPHLSNSSNLFQNELIRIRKEVDESVKFHEDKTTHLKSACAKEIQAIQQKCDVFLREAENTLLQKKLELESHYRKVYANMVLADTVKYKNHKQITSPTSQEALLSEIFEISQLCLPMLSNVAVNNKSVPPPVQVVNRLSELVTFDANTPHNLSTLHNMGHHPAGYHARASAPHHYPQHRVVTCPSTSNMQTSFYGVTDQQTAVWPHGGSVSGWRQPGILPGSLPQLGGTPQIPLQLGGTPQNPLQL